MVRYSEIPECTFEEECESPAEYSIISEFANRTVCADSIREALSWFVDKTDDFAVSRIVSS